MTHRTPGRVAAMWLGAAIVLAACAADQPAATNASAQPSLAPAASATAPSSIPSSSQSPSQAVASVPVALSSDPLHAVVLIDVRSGERLTIGQLAAEKPVLLEAMAIWCSNCRAQQHNVVAAHNEADFTSISLDVDPGEQPADLAAYAEQEGFDWHFAMADADLLGQLRQRFGTAVAVPPGMPKILFRTDGSVELIGLGELYTAQQIADVVAG